MSIYIAIGVLSCLLIAMTWINVTRIQRRNKLDTSKRIRAKVRGKYAHKDNPR